MRGFYFKCSQEQKELWEEAAKATGLSLSTWIKDKLDEAMAAKASNEAEPVPNGIPERADPSPEEREAAAWFNKSRWRCKCDTLNDESTKSCVECGRSRKFAVKS